MVSSGFSNKTYPSRWLRSGAYGYHLCKLKPMMPPSAGMKFAHDTCRNCAKNIPKKDIGSLFWGTSSSCNPKRTRWTIPIGGCWFPVLPRRPLKAIKSRWLDARSPHVARSPRPSLCQRDGPVPAASRTPGNGSGTWEKLRGNHGRSTSNLGLSCKCSDNNWNLGTISLCRVGELRFCTLLCWLGPWEIPENGSFLIAKIQFGSY